MSVANIICDASVLQPGMEAWGWAGACITDRGRAYWSAPGKVKVASSNDAELLAIANTLHQALWKSMILPGETVLVQTDNLHAHNVFNNHFKTRGRIERLPSMTPLQHKAVAHMKDLMTSFPGITHIYARHVKAHLPVGARDARNHVHEKVDELAGLASRQALKDRQHG